MSSSKSRNFRRRGGDDPDDEGQQVTATAGVPKPSSKSTAAAKPKKIHQKLLSFADEESEEDDNAAPSRSSHKPSSSRSSSKPSLSSASAATHKITAAKDRLPPSSSSSVSSSLRSNVQPQAGQYSKEALMELQRSTKTLGGAYRPPPPPRPSLDSTPTAGAGKSSAGTTTSAPAEPIIVLKGSLKPITDKLVGKKDAEKDEEDDVDEDSGEEREDTRRKMGLMGIGKGIPDQAMINAIKAQKERARRSGAAAPDYIALDMGSNHGEAEGLSDEEPEFRSRISMVVDEKEKVKGVFQDIDDGVGTVVGGRVGGVDMRTVVVEEEDEDEEEERRWEEEQFRKGLGKRMDDGTGGVSSGGIVPPAVPRQGLAYPTVPLASQSVVVSAPAVPPSIGGAIVGTEVMPTAQQAELAKRALQDSLRRVKESHARAMASLERTDENLSASLTNITTLEKSLSAAGEKFLFMQKLRDFVSLICDFLQDKAPYIEELEEQMQQHRRERAAANVERRAADNDDEMSEAEAAVNAAMSVISKGGNNSATIAAASSAALAAVAAMKERRLPVELDEMGRDLNLKKRMDMARRAEARRRRRGRWDDKTVSSIANGNSFSRIEGESSTDESDDDNATAYRSHRGLLLETAAGIFGDAAEEYSQLAFVKEKFDKWKKEYGRCYQDAYMALSVPAIFSPYVRLELLKWDPLHEEVDFYDMNWHSLLFDYGIPPDGSDFPADDADANLIPGLVEKVALPVLHHDITHCWDVLSTRETTNAISATSLVINYISTSSEALKELITAIRDRLAVAVTDLVVPSWSALVMKAVPAAARLASYRFGVGIRLMKNICLWKDILALPVLEKLVLDDLLVGKLLPHVRSLTSDVHDSIARTERIIDSLSGVYAGPSVTAAHRQKLQPLIDHVMTLAKMLERKRQASSEEETNGLARRLKKMLVELNEYDQARAIARTFHLREAL